MTPRELLLYVEEYNTRLKREYEEKQRDKEDMLIYAYLNAAWERSKRMPDLKTVLKQMKPRESPETQTPEQMLAAVKRMQAIYDGKEE